MLETIDQENFEEKVLNAEEPVLISYLHRDHSYQEDLAGLFSLSERFQGRVKMFLFSYNCFFLCKELCIMGAPSFIALKNGKEIGRLLGRVSFEELAALCDGMLPRKLQ